MNNEILLKRRSIREYTDKDIDENILIDICKVGMYAPTARNQKTCDFIIVKNKNTIEKLSGLSKNSGFIKNANALICLALADEANLSTPAMASQDLANIMTYMSLEATSKEIGSCYIGIYPYEDRISYVDNVLGIKDGYHACAILALGYPINNDVFIEKTNKIDLNRIHKEWF